MANLQKGSKIRLEKGMTILISLPQKFFYGSTPFSDKIMDAKIKIGEIYRKDAISGEDLVPLALEAVSSILHLPKDAINETSKEKMIDFINSLCINFDEETLDTSIYAGEYMVDAAVNDGDFIFVFCTKVDNPSIHVKFYQVKTSQ